MEIFIVGIILLIFLIIQINTDIISGKRHIDIFDINLKEKLSIYNYKTFELKRKRRPARLRAQSVFIHYTECSLEHEFPTPWSVLPADDIIEVYGIENNRKYLIYKTEWSKNNIKEIKNIVNELNKNNS